MTRTTKGAAVGTWLQDERTEAAAGKILDAAAELFVEQGVAHTGMTEIAKAAGCSRATLYRYFDGRRTLHRAFVEREARRLGRRIVEAVAPISDARARTVEAVLAALREVRSTPTLATWFGIGDAALASELASTSEAIEALGIAFLADTRGDEDPDLTRRARWLVRAIVSLLTAPGTDAEDERAMVEALVDCLGQVRVNSGSEPPRRA